MGTVPGIGFSSGVGQGRREELLVEVDYLLSDADSYGLGVDFFLALLS